MPAAKRSTKKKTAARKPVKKPAAKKAAAKPAARRTPAKKAAVRAKAAAKPKPRAKPARAAAAPAPKSPVLARVSLPADPYSAMLEQLREIAILEAVQRTMSWDQETMMPDKGAALRADQLRTLAGMIHDRRTNPFFGELLAASESNGVARSDGAIQANLREIRRDFDQATRLPKSLVEEMAEVASLAMEAWKEARKNSDFKAFLPWLERVVQLNQRKAQCLGIPAGGSELYDALLDQYEPGMTAARTEQIFGPLRDRLVPLIRKVADVRTPPSDRPAKAITPIDLQKKFVTAICERIGFDFKAGRIDESTHPFCEGIGPGDTRMTNRYRPDGWADALSTAMHESGHALYEQGLPKDSSFGQPLADAISLGIHESQSRMWENQIGRSQAFWKWALPEANRIFGATLMGFGPHDVYAAVNLVKPNLIRVESDELTYNLHIMLRFDLERAMIAGRLSPRDLPSTWNDRVRRDLGLPVPDDRRGCLQDVHWSMGAMGYFPTYTFGNLYSAQLWEAMGREMRDRDERIGKGDFAPILQWLRTNVHAHGRRYSAEDLCKKVTGKPLSHDALLRHLEHKVTAVYGV